MLGAQYIEEVEALLVRYIANFFALSYYFKRTLGIKGTANAECKLASVVNILNDIEKGLSLITVLISKAEELAL